MLRAMTNRRRYVTAAPSPACFAYLPQRSPVSRFAMNSRLFRNHSPLMLTVSYP
jgi:hypothetical protein